MCDGSYSTVEDPFHLTYVPNKIEDVNLKVFNMIKGINKSGTLAKHISLQGRCGFDSEKCNSRQKWDNYKCLCEYKKPIRYRACKENYSWNPSACACECDQDFETGEFWKNCEFMKIHVGDLIVTCDEIKETPESAPTNSRNRIVYWLIPAILLEIACLLLLVIIVVKYHIKHGLKIPRFLSNQCND